MFPAPSGWARVYYQLPCPALAPLWASPLLVTPESDHQSALDLEPTWHPQAPSSGVPPHGSAPPQLHSPPSLHPPWASLSSVGEGRAPPGAPGGHFLSRHPARCPWPGPPPLTAPHVAASLPGLLSLLALSQPAHVPRASRWPGAPLSISAWTGLRVICCDCRPPASSTPCALLPVGTQAGSAGCLARGENSPFRPHPRPGRGAGVSSLTWDRARHSAALPCALGSVVQCHRCRRSRPLGDAIRLVPR